MKNNVLSSILITSLALSHPLWSTESSQKTEMLQKKPQTIIEKWLPTALTTLWASSISFESLCYCLPNMRLKIYGSHQLPKNAINTTTLRGQYHFIGLALRQFFNINTPTISYIETTTASHVRTTFAGNETTTASHLWATFAGNAFCNYSTLFIHKDTMKLLHSFMFIDKHNLTNELINNKINTLDKNTQKAIARALIMINNNYDAKLLGLSIITPPMVWAITHGLNYFMQKLDPAEQKEWVNTLTKRTKQCKESFIAKAAISLSMLATFILYQRYSIGSQAKTIMNNL